MAHIFETKSLPFEQKGEIVEEGDTFTISGYISTRDMDLEGDVVAKECFAESIKARHDAFIAKGRKSNIKFLYQHKREEIIGWPEEIKEDEKGIYVQARFINKPDLFPEAARAHYLAKEGLLDSFSIGFRAFKAKPGKADSGRKTRDIIKGDLIEFSLVSVPMNEMAVVDQVKSAVEDAITKALEAKFANEEVIETALEVKELKDLPIEEIKTLTEEFRLLRAEMQAFREGFQINKPIAVEVETAGSEAEEAPEQKEEEEVTPSEAPEVVEDPSESVPSQEEETPSVEDTNNDNEQLCSNCREKLEHNLSLS